ncbi:hypothetical protein [Salinicoccus sp. HZC-1]|uniref:hypothetical protein n=1 Tax=Salinicoccus sp. HZC-1 TaxID=3385497 RepID=UPI00398B9152
MGKHKFKMTAEQQAIADANNLAQQTISYRVRNKGETLDQAISYPPKGGAVRHINGKRITEDEIDLAEWNGIIWNTLKHRIYAGWDVQRAITEPIRPWPHGQKHKRIGNEPDNARFSKAEVIELIGRMKAMNIAYTKPVLKRAKEYGLSLDSIAPVEVGEA